MQNFKVLRVSFQRLYFSRQGLGIKGTGDLRLQRAARVTKQSRLHSKCRLMSQAPVPSAKLCFGFIKQNLA